jgi:hypothetical protein
MLDKFLKKIGLKGAKLLAWPRRTQALVVNDIQTIFLIPHIEYFNNQQVHALCESLFLLNYNAPFQVPISKVVFDP